MSIYPKNYAIGKRVIEPSTCFVLMPFIPDFNSVYGNIRVFLDGFGIKCNRADDIYESSPILSTIIEHILKAEFIIADLTTRNANVFYEVGLAHAFRDAENVILIARSMDDIPFDIRHLPIIIYDKNNKYLLEESLKNRISVSREKVSQKRFLINYLSDSDFSFSSVEKTIDLIKDRNKQFVEYLHILLSDKDDFSKRNIDEFDVKKFLEEIDTFSILADGETSRLLYKVKLDVLINVSNIESISKYSLTFLKDYKRNVLDSSYRDDLAFSADYACQLINKNLHKSLAINWLLNYLSNSRVGGIDVIRNKIDEFLINISDKDVDRALLNLFSSDNSTLRESSVDLLTQKQNENAYSLILTKMQSENNIYVVRSMINGLARYDNPSSTYVVANWFKENKHIVKANNAIFLYNVGIDFLKRFNAFHYVEEITRLYNGLF